MKRYCTLCLLLAITTLSGAQVARHNHQTDSIMMARVDSIYDAMSDEDVLAIPAKYGIVKKDFYNYDKRDFESEHYFMRAALFGYRQLSELMRIFGSNVMDYYLADGAVEDFYSEYELFTDYYGSRRRYLASNERRKGSYYLYGGIQWLTSNFSKLRDRASFSGLRGTDRYEKRETCVISLDDMRIVDSLHRYPAEYTYLYDKDMAISRTIFNKEDYPKEIEKARKLLDEKRTTVGIHHPGYALTLSELAYLNSKQAYPNGKISDYRQAIELQRQALAIYRATGCQTAVRLAARQLSHLCYKQRYDTYDYRTATHPHSDFTERQQLAQQEIDSLAPLLGPDSPEMEMARQEIKKWEEMREKYDKDKAWKHINSICDRLTAEEKEQLKKELSMERPCYTFEYNHHFLRAALCECQLMNFLHSTFGHAAVDTAIVYQRRSGQYFYNSVSLWDFISNALYRIVVDNSNMDYRIGKAMGKKNKGIYAGNTLKQFGLEEAMPLVKAHQYPEKYKQLSTKDDELAVLITQDTKKAFAQAKQLLDEKASTIGKRHPGYALTLSDMALLHMLSTKSNQEDSQRDSLFEQAVQLQTQAINIYRKARLPVAERLSLQFLSNIFYCWDDWRGSDRRKNPNDSTRAVLEKRKLRELGYTVPVLGENSPEVMAAQHELQILQGYNEALIADRHERGKDEQFANAVALYRQGQYEKALGEFSYLSDEKFTYLPNRKNYSKLWVAACHRQLGDTAQAAKTDPYYLLPPIDRTKTLEMDYLLQFSPNYHTLLTMAVDTLGAGTPELARMLLKFFEVFRDHSQFTEAADALSRAKTLCRSHVGEDSPLYANILSNQASLYQNIHYYQEAVLTLEESVALTARLQGRHSPAYAHLLEDLVANSKLMEDKRRVARWLQERLDADTALTADNRIALMNDYVTNAKSLAIETHTDTVILQRAADYAHQVIDYRLREAYSKRPPVSNMLSVADMHKYYNSIYSAMQVALAQAICYKNMGRTDQLKEIENQWSTWMNDSIGWSPETPWEPHNLEHIYDCCFAVSRLTFCYMNLGFLFRHCGNNELATEASRRASETQAYREHNMRLLVRENAAVYDAMQYVANVIYALNLREQKQYDEARDLLLKVQRLRKEYEGDHSQTYHNVESYFIGLLNKTGKHNDAAEHLNKWWNHQCDAILRQLVVLNGPQREQLWNQKKKLFESTAQCEAILTGKTEVWGLLYDNALLCKGLLLNTEMEIERAISRNTDTEQAALYRQLKENQLLLMGELQKPKQSRTVDTDSLQSFIRTQSYNLMNSLQGERSNDLVRNLRTSWTDVAQRLGKKDVAVEFIAVPMKADSVVYAALTLRKGYEHPCLTTLCTLQQLKEMPPADYYGSSKLYDLLWRPLESELQGAANIYFAPIGKLHQIGIEYLPGMEQYNTYRLSSTRELVTATANKKRTIDAALYGGLNFELSDEERDAIATRQEGTAHSAFRDIPDMNRLREMRGAVEEMPVLEGSLHEVEDIDRLMRKKRIKVTTAIGNDGTEEDFKALSGQHKSLIHISTHGFYQPEQPQQNNDDDDLQSLLGNNRQAQTQEDNSLSRSGLLMTGAADYIFGRVDNLSTDDGILTAREISRLDLSGLDLVVLSACETGLGDISGEGVYGLQRGFKKAGAQTLLVSLWKVDDEATQLLMTEFYRGLLDGKTKRQAFIDAQRYLRSAQGGRFNRYECWAAFVMIDALS